VTNSVLLPTPFDTPTSAGVRAGLPRRDEHDPYRDEDAYQQYEQEPQCLAVDHAVLELMASLP